MSGTGIAARLSGILPGRVEAGLVTRVTRLPEPEAALRVLQRYVDAAGPPADPGRLQALLTLGGYSPYLGELLVRHPAFIDVLPVGGPAPGVRTREDLDEDLARFQLLNAGTDLSLVLRRFKQREYLRIALADFFGTADLPAITRALSLLADVLLEKAVQAARVPLQARYGMPTSRDQQGRVVEAGFVVIALGKLGGGELNYSSDIDLIYLYSRDGETTGGGSAPGGVIINKEYFGRLATEVTRLIAGFGEEGQVFRVDLDLRPGGRDGELVVPYRAAEAYYRNWAEPWERQALMKARPVAGDLELGRRFLSAVEALIYAEAPDPYQTLEIGAMKDRIDSRLSAAGRSASDIKLGWGGIREMEFSVQALQLRHGGRDPWLRQGNTLLALHRLAEKGYVSYPELASLSQAYTFLRNVEHRLQLGQNRQTANLPGSREGWAILERRMRAPETPGSAAVEPLADELERHRRAIRGFYDSVFARAAQTALGEESIDIWLDRTDESSLKERLRRSGIIEADSAIKPVQMIRRLLQPAATDPDLRRTLRKDGPLLLQAAVGTRAPRRALRNLEKLLSSLACEPEGLAGFLAHREILAPTVNLLGRSDLFAGLLARQPTILRALADRARILRAPGPAEYRDILLQAAGGHTSARSRAGALRRRHQEALTIIAMRDINRQASLREVLKSLSHLADAAVEAAVLLARDEMTARGQPPPPGLRVAVIGLGRLGYQEMDYESDLDLIFVHDGGGAAEATRVLASRWCEGVVRILTTLSQDGQLYRVDLRLRPAGREGDLVTTVDSLARYFSGTAEVWEMQSFLKARPVAGDVELGARAVDQVEAIVLRRARALGGTAIATAVDGMRRRLLAGGTDGVQRGTEVKLGEGGILDIHFIIECQQLLHALENPADKDTLRLLTLLNDRGCLADEPMHDLYEAYLFLRALEHALRVVHDRPLSRLPEDTGRLYDLALTFDPNLEDPDAAAADLMGRFRAHTARVRAIFADIVGGA